MGKKKSKSQKMRKKKIQKIRKEQLNKNVSKRKIVSSDSVIYNVALTKPELLNIKKRKVNIVLDAVKETITKILSKIEDILPKKEVTVEIKKVKKVKKTKPKKVKLVEKNQVKNNIVKELVEEIELPKLKKKKKELITSDSNNIIIKILYNIKINSHIIFNSILIICFIMLLIGLIRINTLKGGTIAYIAILVGFLSLVAISHNRYLSGKVFSIVLCLGMGVAIYQLNYTYDFIRNLNTYKYEYKTYYVVTFDTNINKSIYNINNKKVGLLNDNSTNIERMLNTKLDKAEYFEYDNVNLLFDNFYNQKLRAVIVNENEYKYLVNNEAQGARNVKILYEFQVNGLKV